MNESKDDASPSHSDVVITCFAMLVALLACAALNAPNVHLCARIALLTVLLASFMAPLQSIILCVAMHSDPNKCYAEMTVVHAYQLIVEGTVVASHDWFEVPTL